MDSTIPVRQFKGSKPMELVPLKTRPARKQSRLQRAAYGLSLYLLWAAMLLGLAAALSPVIPL